MSFNVLTIGSRASRLAAMTRSWRGIAASVRTATAEKCTGPALVLVDDDPGLDDAVCAATQSLGADGAVAFLAVAHERSHLTGEEWNRAARLNSVTRTPVIWPVDSADDTINDLLHAYASAMVGWGNVVCFDMADLAAIAAPPCVGIFGRWDVGGNSVEFARRYGRTWGPPPRAAFLTVRAGPGCGQSDLERVATSVMGQFSPDDDFLFTSNIVSEHDRPPEALLTVFCGPRR